MKAIIVDDEVAARNILSNLLSLSFPEIDIVAKEASVPDAVLAIKKHQPDVVFLDIEMPKYAGYEIAKFFDVIDFHIVFVTAYDKYAIKAFEINAVDYLLKPIDRKRLALAVKKVEQKIKDNIVESNYHQLLNEIEKENSKTITVAEQTKKHIIPINSIIGIEANGAYSIVYCKDIAKITFSKNIGYFEELLKGESIFFRSHKSWLINIKRVTSYSKGDALIHLEDTLTCKLSRFKKNDFEEAVVSSNVLSV